jgi:hypothetical protein
MNHLLNLHSFNATGSPPLNGLRADDIFTGSKKLESWIQIHYPNHRSFAIKTLLSKLDDLDTVAAHELCFIIVDDHPRFDIGRQQLGQILLKTNSLLVFHEAIESISRLDLIEPEALQAWEFLEMIRAQRPHELVNHPDIVATFARAKRQLVDKWNAASNNDNFLIQAEEIIPHTPSLDSFTYR